MPCFPLSIHVQLPAVPLALPNSCADIEGVLQADDKFAGYKPTVAFFFPGQGAQTVGMAQVRHELQNAPSK